MKLSEFKAAIEGLQVLNFVQTNGNPLPAHFHITEAGLTTKHFIDCGGTVRTEKNVNFQIWVADDTQHRLSPQKLSKIINVAQPLLGSDDLDVEIEYQSDTIGRFGLMYNGEKFLLIPKQTDCLAMENCGIPQNPGKSASVNLSSAASCTPGGGCC